MRVICTICSKAKSTRAELLPAFARYTSPHILETKEIAKRENIPFYILSGKFGIIPDHTEIPHYDYYLPEDKVAELADVIANQIKTDGITEIIFYAKLKWVPYIQAITVGAKQGGADLTIYELTEDSVPTTSSQHVRV